MTELAEKKIPSYRDKRFDFSHFAPLIDDALHRAIKLEQSHMDSDAEEIKNPSTSMWKFIQAVERHGKRAVRPQERVAQ